MSKARDLTRFFGNKALKNQTVGGTYGERMEKRQRLEQQKAQTVQKPVKHRPVDNFASKGNRAPKTQFVNSRDRYVGKSYRSKNTVAYKSVASELLEFGRAGTKLSDDDILKFTEMVSTRKELWNPINVRKTFGKRPPQAGGANNAKRTVKGMAKAQAMAKKKTVRPRARPTSARPTDKSSRPVVNVPRRKA
jgi:hypothetical protein